MDKFKVENIEAVKKILADVDHLDNMGYWPEKKTPVWAKQIFIMNFHNHRVPIVQITGVAYRACINFLMSKNGN